MQSGWSIVPLPDPIPFCDCLHTSPPCPSPAVAPSGPAPRFPTRCLSCAIRRKAADTAMILELYGNLIATAQAELRRVSEEVPVSDRRRGRAREKRWEQAITAARGWLADLQRDRDVEVRDVWKGLVDLWDGGLVYRKSRFGGEIIRERLNLRIQYLRNGNAVVQGVEEDDLGVGEEY